MIGIKKGNEYLDLQPNTQLQRERQSPVFLDQTEDGKDGIPGEISYPFTLPLSDRNIRLLNFPDMLPMVKTLQHDVLLEDSGMQLSNGKLVIDTVTSHLNKNNVGAIDCHILSNVSEFWQRVRSKKLSELSLGGERSFTWAGYDLVTTGFWKHCHDTWAYTDADDGDYVFTPLYAYHYETENQVKVINNWEEHSGQIQLAREYNYNCLCPHPFVVYILKKVFTEHGYSIGGDILDDPDFKQICFESYRSVNWAVPTINGPLATPTVTVAPTNPVTLRLAEHVPPAMTIGEFLVELQKLLPIAFVINDRAKSCRVVLLTDLANAGASDSTPKFNPSFSLAFDAKENTSIYGFDRVNSDEFTVNVLQSEYDYQGVVNSLSDLPTANSTNQNKMYFVKYLNQYHACINAAETGGSGTLYYWLLVGDNVGGYLPENQNNTITSAFEVAVIRYHTMILHYYGVGDHLYMYLPWNSQRGNWYASGLGRDFEPWAPRLFFFRGSQTFSAGGTKPLATNGIYNFNSADPMTGSHDQVGEWSLSYESPDGEYGLIGTYWGKWLPVLELNEVIKGRLYLKFHEYLQWDWSNVLLIQNTPYLIKKVTEVLPYAGHIDIEAQRIK
jgi:hypothetical protein